MPADKNPPPSLLVRRCSLADAACDHSRGDRASSPNHSTVQRKRIAVNILTGLRLLAGSAAGAQGLLRAIHAWSLLKRAAVVGRAWVGVCVALAGLRKRATVRRSRISDVLVFMKCYKIGYFVIMNILHRGAEPHLEAVPPPRRRPPGSARKFYF